MDKKNGHLLKKQYDRDLTMTEKFVKILTKLNSGFVLLTAKWSLPHEVQILETVDRLGNDTHKCVHVCSDGLLLCYICFEATTSKLGKAELQGEFTENITN